ncbi:MAG: 50S ribosomal protein L32 [Holosporales bacterium]
MAVPKKKTSKSRRNMRRSHHHLSDIAIGECSNCGAKKLPHHLCDACGYYKGIQIVKVKKA